MPDVECIKVVIRCRPLTDKEKSSYCKTCVTTDADSKSLVIKKPHSTEDSHFQFSFDAIYNELASYLEIYKEELRDLLNNNGRRLETREKPNGEIYVKDLTSVLAKDVCELRELMKISSDSTKHLRVGKLNLVDLAGSERQSKAQSEGERFREAVKINLGLSTLGNVIASLVESNKTTGSVAAVHIPYRDSKLTRLLQDSLGGNSRTVMVANIGPADYNYHETLSTLRYASRAKKVKNVPRINEDPKHALLKEYKAEIERLKGLLARQTQKCEKSWEREGYTSTVDSVESNDEVSCCLDDFMRIQREKLDREKESIINSQTVMGEEKSRLLEQLKNKQDRLTERQQQADQLKAKLAEMERKLLKGHHAKSSPSASSKTARAINSIVEQTKRQQASLDQSRGQLDEQKQLHSHLKARMSATDSTMVALHTDCASLQYEVEVNTRKLRKLYAKLQTVQQAIQSETDAHILARGNLEYAMGEATKRIKLRQAILDNFIPARRRQAVENRIYYDEEADQLRLGPCNMSGDDAKRLFLDVSTKAKPTRDVGDHLATINQSPAPLLDIYAEMARALAPQLRSQFEPIVDLDLQLSDRVTTAYKRPRLGPKYIEALEAALQDDEQELVLDGKPSIFKPGTAIRLKKKVTSLLRPDKKSNSKPDNRLYPKPRGLVPR